MSSATTNIIVAGIGGQGVLTCSDIIAEAAFRAGLDVKKAEVHGMSQRGGSVASDVRFGAAVLSPMIPDGEAAFLLVLEATQEETAKYRLAPNGQTLRCTDIDAKSLPSEKTINIAILGMLSTKLPFPESTWLEAIHANLPPKLHEMNDKAFAAGRTAAS